MYIYPNSREHFENLPSVDISESPIAGVNGIVVTEIAGVFASKASGEVRLIASNGIELTTKASLSECKKLFDSAKVSTLRITSTQQDNPIEGFISARFAEISGFTTDGQTPVLKIPSYKGSCDDAFYALNDDEASLMSQHALHELGVR